MSKVVAISAKEITLQSFPYTFPINLQGGRTGSISKRGNTVNIL